MDNEKEISFGAFDSELMHQEIYIPEGFEATIDGDKIILTRKESKDERISKKIKKVLNWYRKSFSEKSLRNEEYDEMFAWLEKQGTSYTKKDVDDAFVEGMAFAKDELEKQKPTLSKKEEKARRALIEMVHDTIPAEFEKCNTTKVDCLVWLRKQGKQKSVGEEIVEALRTEYEKGRADAFAQMQKEWSEEDEKIKEDILYDLNTLLEGNKSEWAIKDLKKEINWLQSLKPQNQWKPSDEQIGLLQAIINEPKNAASESCQIVLKDTLKQLKKLKEE